jgi:hypothetical protein
MRLRPSSVLGPVLSPPWREHRPVRLTAGLWQGVPDLVLAPQRFPGQSTPNRVARPISTLPFKNRMITPDKTDMLYYIP